MGLRVRFVPASWSIVTRITREAACHIGSRPSWSRSSRTTSAWRSSGSRAIGRGSPRFAPAAGHGPRLRPAPGLLTRWESGMSSKTGHPRLRTESADSASGSGTCPDSRWRLGPTSSPDLPPLNGPSSRARIQGGRTPAIRPADAACRVRGHPVDASKSSLRSFCGTHACLPQVHGRSSHGALKPSTRPERPRPA